MEQLRIPTSPQQSPPSAMTSSPPRFKGLRTVSSGPSGLLQEAFDHAASQKVVVRYLPREQVLSGYKYVVREVLNHRQLSLCKHPHLLQFQEVFLTPRYLGIVMEHFPGQGLQSYLDKHGGSLPEDTCRFIFQQCLLAVDFMHRKGKVHRDIKLDHILVEDSGSMPLIKLRAFHYSKDRVHDSAPVTQCGTALFTAPEVFMNVQSNAYDGEAVDVWSCGVILCIMLFGSHPFLAESDQRLSAGDQMTRLIENMVKGQLQLPEWAADTMVADLLCRILVPSPCQRYKIKDIVQHPWFQMGLPPGALDLNSSCMMQNHEAEMAQTPAAIQQIISLVHQSQAASGSPTVSRTASHSGTTGTSTDFHGYDRHSGAGRSSATDKQALKAWSLSADCAL